MRLILGYYRKNLLYRTRAYIIVTVVMLFALLTVDAAVMYINSVDNHLLDSSFIRDYDIQLSTADPAVSRFLDNSDDVESYKIIGRTLDISGIMRAYQYSMIFSPYDGAYYDFIDTLGYMEVVICNRALSFWAPYINDSELVIPGFTDENGDDLVFKVVGYSDSYDNYSIYVSYETMDMLDSLYYGVRQRISIFLSDDVKEPLEFTKRLSEEFGDRISDKMHGFYSTKSGILFENPLDSGDTFILVSAIVTAALALHFTLKIKRDGETDDIRILFSMGMSPFKCLVLYMLDIVIIWMLVFPTALAIMFWMFKLMIGVDNASGYYVVRFTPALLKQTAVCGSIILLPRLVLDILRLFTSRSWEILKPAELQLAHVYRGFVRRSSKSFVSAKNFIAPFVSLLIRRERMLCLITALFIAIPLFLCSIYLNRGNNGFTGPELTATLYSVGDTAGEAELIELAENARSMAEVEEVRLYREYNLGEYRMKLDDDFIRYLPQLARDSNNFKERGDGTVLVSTVIRELNESNVGDFTHIDAGSIESVMDGGLLIVDNRHREPERYFDVGDELTLISSDLDEGVTLEVSAVASHYEKNPTHFLMFASAETIALLEAKKTSVPILEINISDDCDRYEVIERINDSIGKGKLRVTDLLNQYNISQATDDNTVKIASTLTVMNSLVMLIVTVLMWHMMKTRRSETYGILTQLGLPESEVMRCDAVLTGAVVLLGTLVYIAAYAVYLYNVSLSIYNMELYGYNVYIPFAEIAVLFVLLCTAMFAVVIRSKKEKEVNDCENNDR